MWDFFNKPKKRIFSICALFVLYCAGAFCQNYYWENPERVSQGNSCFPRAVSNDNNAAAFWQEVDSENSAIYISAQFYKGGVWKNVPRFAGPFPYSGEVPDLYSVAMNANGTVSLGVLSDTDTISIYTSSNLGESFSVHKTSRAHVPLVAPRIYELHSGGFIIFTSLGKDESFSMLYARSKDGFSWNNFEEFSPASNSLNPFLPVVLSTEKGETVVFQAQYRLASRIVYRLFSTQSKGSSWTSPVMLVTGTDEDLAGDQRPTLCNFNGTPYIAWERTPYNSENSNICFAELNPQNGTISGRVERISNSGNANRPVLFSHNDVLSLVWFDTRGGSERVYFCQRHGILWGEQSPLSPAASASMFAFPMVTDSKQNLSFIWQTGSGRQGAVYRIEADHTVPLPNLTALSFVEGRRSRDEDVRVRVALPQDSSGIRGFSWVWSQNPGADVPRTLMNLPRENMLSLKASSDRNWYLKVRSVDYADNWSDVAILTYFRDRTPPNPPLIDQPALDEAGFVQNNSFTVRWRDNTYDEEIAGYSYRLEEQYPISKTLATSTSHPTGLTYSALQAELGLLKQKNPESAFRPRAPQNSIQTRAENSSFTNLSNGAYTFSVRSFDSAGNISEPNFITLYINKYEPYTQITSVKKSTDIFGNSSLELYGTGFLYDGTISNIILTRQSEEPYSLDFSLSNADYSVVSDSRIAGIKLESTIPQGTYSITLNHTDRGRYTLRGAFSVQENGTVKIAPIYKYKPSWRTVYDNGKFYVQTIDILFAIIMIFAIAALLFAAKGIAASSKQAAILSKEIHALMTGDIMPLEKKKKAAFLNKRGISLKLKLISFTAIIVITVSLLVSLPLGYIMTRTQERTLSSGLEERVNVLLGSLSSGVRAYMPTQNVLELSALPSQSSALPEANFVTITGLPSNDGSPSGLHYVWASNDQNLSQITDGETLNPGVTEITSPMLLEISSACSALNDQAFSAAGEMAQNIAELNAEGARIVLRTDEASVKRRNEISLITTQLTTRLTETLNNIAESNTMSYPAYNGTQIDRQNTEYLFYRPVLYRAGSSKTYVRGIVFVSVSTENLIKTIASEQRTIFYTALIVALAAVLFGTIGSWILASIIVSPIKRLAAHVQMIGATANKEKLAGKEIVVKSRDEIGQLGDSVNDMTRELVKAAQEEHLSMDGKVVQRAFLPLTADKSGAKQTVAILNDKNIQTFGYYEGASEVSGDYFDYKKLDDTHYVLIKCDASGHGVPAALIMTVVATLFRRYYENWSYKKNGVDLDSLVTQINDFIESLGIKGKFATLIIVLIDTATGEVNLCNAGDNIVHVFDSRAKKEKVLTLQETPAAGPLPTFMVQMKGGFKVEKTHLNKGDFLFLYTDGIEESTRKFRSPDFKIIQCEESVDVKDGVHGNHKVGAESEQMEPYRIQEVIEAVLNKKVYTLQKFHNPIPDEKLEFDFTKCTGTTEEVILALCSVEKVFRLYKDNAATEKDEVRVDRRIDAFLKAHFNRYDYYCASKAEDSGEGAYIYYTSLKEDEQLDDLTLLAVKIV